MTKYCNLNETVNKFGEVVCVKGWVSSRRNMGKIVFLDVRDRFGNIQTIGASKDLSDASIEALTQARLGWLVSITGIVQKRGDKQKNFDSPVDQFEILIKEIAIISKSEA